MVTKKASRRTKGSKYDAFNRSQQIYKLLEKGIIESEALSSGAADRPEDDAHVLELLEKADESTQTGAVGSQRVSKQPTGTKKARRTRPKFKRSSRPKIKNVKRKYSR